MCGGVIHIVTIIIREEEVHQFKRGGEKEQTWRGEKNMETMQFIGFVHEILKIK